MLRIGFRARDERYALPASRVVEVIPRVRLRPVALAPPEIAGLLVYRGRVAPVVDLSVLLAGEPCPDRLSSRIVVVELRGKPEGAKRLVGLLAEGLTDVTADPAPAQPALAVPGAPFLGEVVPGHGGLVQLIEPEALIPDELFAVLLLAPGSEALPAKDEPPLHGAEGPRA